MQDIQQIFDTIQGLSKEEQEKLIERLTMKPEEIQDSLSMLMDVKKTIQEKDEFSCTHCQSDKIVGHGNYQGRKRYKCVSCKKTFNDLTGTAVSHIHKKEEWKTYLGCMSENMSLRKSAAHTGISLKTSFIWRHKILSAFKDVGCSKMEGIIEGDETFFLYSEKGKKSIKDRDPRQRGGKSSKRGINDEHVAVIVATDRNKRPIIEVACRGRVSTDQIEACIGKWIADEASVLCSDSHRSYERFAKNNQLKHVQINASKGQHVKDKVYHIQNINNIHSLLKEWVKKFKGVASGYLQNYMNWFRIQRMVGNDIVKYLEYAITSNKAYVQVKNIKPQLITT